MSELNDDGPAFPSGVAGPEYGDHAGECMEQGMSLRDYFAAASLAALSKDFRSATGISENIRRIAELNARLAYLVADAMLAERKRKPT